MTLRLNIAANYLGQGYTGLIGLAVTPVYLSMMGPEAFGLIAVFQLLQVWLQLLELGLGAALLRETARFRSGALDIAELWRFLRALEWLFWPMGVIVGVALALCAPWFARSWLQVHGLPERDVDWALLTMAFAVGTRWTCGLYRSVLSGLEQLVRLNAIQAAIATLRFVAVIPFLAATTSPVVTFFGFQLAVSVIELAVLALAARGRLPKVATSRWPSWQVLIERLPFAGTIALASVVWIAVTQADKVVLSHMLALADYGFFSAVAMLAGVISVLGIAISQALLPQMTRELGQHGLTAALKTYRTASQFTALVAGSIALTLALCAQDILWIWFGDRQVAQAFAPVLSLYAVGNAMVAVASYSYCLQYAHGRMRMHLVGNLLFAVTLVPAVVVAASHYGATGAAWVWMAVSAVFLLVWAPIVHARFAPGLNTVWLTRDVLAPLLGPLLVFGLLHLVGPWGASRVDGVVRAGLAVLGMVGSGALTLRWTRGR